MLLVTVMFTVGSSTVVSSLGQWLRNKVIFTSCDKLNFLVTCHLLNSHLEKCTIYKNDIWTRSVCGFFLGVLVWKPLFWNQYTHFHISGCPHTAALTIVVSYIYSIYKNWITAGRLDYTCYKLLWMLKYSSTKTDVTMHWFLQNSTAIKYMHVHCGCYSHHFFFN